MSTPNGNASAYASIANLTDHTDIRVIADCLEDLGLRAGGTQPTLATILADPTAVSRLQYFLNMTAGWIEDACLVGNKYTAGDLLALTGNSLADLQGLNCDLATWKLMQRRWPTMAPTEEYRSAMEKLERLRYGERIFSLQAQGNAGLPNETALKPTTVCLSTDRARRFYGSRTRQIVGQTCSGGGCGCS